MAGRGLTEQIFFVYDHTTLQKEEDDLKDAIVYFFPPTVKDDDQCALCGQLMGMVSFFQFTWSAKPHLYKLTRHKFVVKHVENRYTMALGRNQLVSDNCLEEELSLLYNTFTLYKGSLGSIRENCVSNGLSFTETLKPIWECFLPFCCAYGDTVRHGFLSLPTIELPKSGSDVFLQASGMLQSSKRRPGVLGGAVLSSNSVLCTQLSEELTSRFLVIKPQQTHLPCEPVKTEFPLPVGVRIINVYVNPEEYQKLFHQSIGASCKHTKVSNFRPNQRNMTDDPPPYSFVRNNMNISQNATVQDFDTFAHSSGSSVHLDTLTNVGCQGDGSVETRNPTVSHQLAQNSKEKSGLKLSESVAMGYEDCATNQNPDFSSSPEDDFIGPNSSIKSDNSSTKLSFSADVHIDGDKSLVPRHNDPESKSDPSSNTVMSDQISVADSQIIHFNDNKGCDINTEAVLSSAQNNVTKLEVEPHDSVNSKAHSKDTEFEGQTTEGINKTNLLTGAPEKITNFDDKVNKSCTDVKNPEKENNKTVFENHTASNDSCSGGLSSPDVETKISEGGHSDSSDILDIDGVQKSPENTPQLVNDSRIVQNPSDIVTENPRTAVKNSIIGTEVQSEHAETRNNCSEIRKNISDEVINPHLESQKAISDNGETAVDKHSTESHEKLPDNKINSVSKISDNVTSTFSENESNQKHTVSQNSYGNYSADSAISVSEDHLVSGSFEEDCGPDSLTTKGIESLSDTFSTQNEGKETFVFSEMERRDDKRSSSSETSVFQNITTKTVEDNYSSALTYNAQISSNNPGQDGQNSPHGDNMKSLTLYIQGHSDSMLILLMEEVSRYDKDCIHALWKLALPQLGDLDFHVKELIETESPRPAHEDYYFLRFNEFQRQVSVTAEDSVGNVTKPVASGEYEFCDLAIDLHEEFRKTPSLTELCVRTHLANVYAHRSVNHEIYFQSINKHRQANGLPFAKDAVFSLDQIAQRKLHKHHNITFV